MVCESAPKPASAWGTGAGQPRRTSALVVNLSGPSTWRVPHLFAPVRASGDGSPYGLPSLPQADHVKDAGRSPLGSLRAGTAAARDGTAAIAAVSKTSANVDVGELGNSRLPGRGSLEGSPVFRDSGELEAAGLSGLGSKAVSPVSWRHSEHSAQHTVLVGSGGALPDQLAEPLWIGIGDILDAVTRETSHASTKPRAGTDLCSLLSTFWRVVTRICLVPPPPTSAVPSPLTEFYLRFLQAMQHTMARVLVGESQAVTLWKCSPVVEFNFPWSMLDHSSRGSASGTC